MLRWGGGEDGKEVDVKRERTRDLMAVTAGVSSALFTVEVRCFRIRAAEAPECLENVLRRIPIEEEVIVSSCRAADCGVSGISACSFPAFFALLAGTLNVLEAKSLFDGLLTLHRKRRTSEGPPSFA